MCLGCGDLLARLLLLFRLGLRRAQSEDRSRGGRGDLAGTGERKPDGGSTDQQIELVAATRVEEPIPPVDGTDRHEHHAGNRGRPEWSEQAENEKRAASELGEPVDCGKHTSGPQAHRLEPTPGAGKTVATEPPEQLLGAVGHHDRSQYDSQEQRASVHLVPPPRLFLSRVTTVKLAAASNYSP